MSQTSPPALTAIGARLRVARKESELWLELFLLLSSVLDVSPDQMLAPDDGDEASETERQKGQRRRSRPLGRRLDELVQQVELLRRKILAFREDLAPPPA